MSTQKTIPARRAANVAALMQIKDVTKEDALKIRHIWKTTKSRQEAREEIDKVLRTYGVEYLGQHRRTGREVYYCNTGESYATTVVFIGPSLYVNCWADYAEKNLVVSPQQF